MMIQPYTNPYRVVNILPAEPPTFRYTDPYSVKLYDKVLNPKYNDAYQRVTEKSRRDMTIRNFVTNLNDLDTFINSGNPILNLNYNDYESWLLDIVVTPQMNVAFRSEQLVGTGSNAKEDKIKFIEKLDNTGYTTTPVNATFSGTRLKDLLTTNIRDVGTKLRAPFQYYDKDDQNNPFHVNFMRKNTSMSDDNFMKLLEMFPFQTSSNNNSTLYLLTTDKPTDIGIIHNNSGFPGRINKDGDFEPADNMPSPFYWSNASSSYQIVHYGLKLIHHPSYGKNQLEHPSTGAFANVRIPPPKNLKWSYRFYREVIDKIKADPRYAGDKFWRVFYGDPVQDTLNYGNYKFNVLRFSPGSADIGDITNGKYRSIYELFKTPYEWEIEERRLSQLNKRIVYAELMVPVNTGSSSSMNLYIPLARTNQLGINENIGYIPSDDSFHAFKQYISSTPDAEYDTLDLSLPWAASEVAQDTEIKMGGKLMTFIANHKDEFTAAIKDFYHKRFLVQMWRGDSDWTYRDYSTTHSSVSAMYYLETEDGYVYKNKGAGNTPVVFDLRNAKITYYTDTYYESRIKNNLGYGGFIHHYTYRDGIPYRYGDVITIDEHPSSYSANDGSRRTYSLGDPLYEYYFWKQAIHAMRVRVFLQGSRKAFIDIPLGLHQNGYCLPMYPSVDRENNRRAQAGTPEMVYYGTQGNKVRADHYTKNKIFRFNEVGRTLNGEVHFYERDNTTGNPVTYPSMVDYIKRTVLDILKRLTDDEFENGLLGSSISNIRSFTGYKSRQQLTIDDLSDMEIHVVADRPNIWYYRGKNSENEASLIRNIIGVRGAHIEVDGRPYFSLYPNVNNDDFLTSIPYLGIYDPDQPTNWDQLPRESRVTSDYLNHTQKLLNVTPYDVVTGIDARWFTSGYNLYSAETGHFGMLRYSPSYRYGHLSDPDYIRRLALWHDAKLIEFGVSSSYYTSRINNHITTMETSNVITNEYFIYGGLGPRIGEIIMFLMTVGLDYWKNLPRSEWLPVFEQTLVKKGRNPQFHTKSLKGNTIYECPLFIRAYLNALGIKPSSSGSIKVPDRYKPLIEGYTITSSDHIADYRIQNLRSEARANKLVRLYDALMSKRFDIIIDDYLDEFIHEYPDMHIPNIPANHEYKNDLFTSLELQPDGNGRSTYQITRGDVDLSQIIQSNHRVTVLDFMSMPVPSFNDDYYYSTSRKQWFKLSDQQYRHLYVDIDGSYHLLHSEDYSKMYLYYGHASVLTYNQASPPDGNLLMQVDIHNNFTGVDFARAYFHVCQVHLPHDRQHPNFLYPFFAFAFDPGELKEVIDEFMTLPEVDVRNRDLYDTTFPPTKDGITALLNKISELKVSKLPSIRNKHKITDEVLSYKAFFGPTVSHVTLLEFHKIMTKTDPDQILYNLNNNTSCRGVYGALSRNNDGAFYTKYGKLLAADHIKYTYTRRVKEGLDYGHYNSSDKRYPVRLIDGEQVTDTWKVLDKYPSDVDFKVEDGVPVFPNNFDRQPLYLPPGMSKYDVARYWSLPTASKADIPTTPPQGAVSNPAGDGQHWCNLMRGAAAQCHHLVSACDTLLLENFGYKPYIFNYRNFYTQNLFDLYYCSLDEMDLTPLKLPVYSNNSSGYINITPCSSYLGDYTNPDTAKYKPSPKVNHACTILAVRKYRDRIVPLTTAQSITDALSNSLFNTINSSTLGVVIKRIFELNDDIRNADSSKSIYKNWNDYLIHLVNRIHAIPYSTQNAYTFPVANKTDKIYITPAIYGYLVMMSEYYNFINEIPVDNKTIFGSAFALGRKEGTSDKDFGLLAPELSIMNINRFNQFNKKASMYSDYLGKNPSIDKMTQLVSVKLNHGDMKIRIGVYPYFNVIHPVRPSENKLTGNLPKFPHINVAIGAIRRGADAYHTATATNANKFKAYEAIYNAMPTGSSDRAYSTHKYPYYPENSSLYAPHMRSTNAIEFNTISNHNDWNKHHDRTIYHTLQIPTLRNLYASSLIAPDSVNRPLSVNTGNEITLLPAVNIKLESAVRSRSDNAEKFYDTKALATITWQSIAAGNAKTLVESQSTFTGFYPALIPPTSRTTKPTMKTSWMGRTNYAGIAPKNLYQSGTPYAIGDKYFWHVVHPIRSDLKSEFGLNSANMDNNYAPLAHPDSHNNKLTDKTKRKSQLSIVTDNSRLHIYDYTTIIPVKNPTINTVWELMAARFPFSVRLVNGYNGQNDIKVNLPVMRTSSRELPFPANQLWLYDFIPENIDLVKANKDLYTNIDRIFALLPTRDQTRAEYARKWSDNTAITGMLPKIDAAVLRVLDSLSLRLSDPDLRTRRARDLCYLALFKVYPDDPVTMGIYGVLYTPTQNNMNEIRNNNSYFRDRHGVDFAVSMALQEFTVEEIEKYVKLTGHSDNNTTNVVTMTYSKPFYRFLRQFYDVFAQAIPPYNRIPSTNGAMSIAYLMAKDNLNHMMMEVTNILKTVNPVINRIANEANVNTNRTHTYEWSPEFLLFNRITAAELGSKLTDNSLHPVLLNMLKYGNAFQFGNPIAQAVASPSSRSSILSRVAAVSNVSSATAIRPTYLVHISAMRYIWMAQGSLHSGVKEVAHGTVNTNANNKRILIPSANPHFGPQSHGALYPIQSTLSNDTKKIAFSESLLKFESFLLVHNHITITHNGQETDVIFYTDNTITHRGSFLYYMQAISTEIIA